MTAQDIIIRPIITERSMAGIGMKKAGPKSSGKPYLKEER